ncbi:hypothetical protein K466DRAFT_648231 [Polyporus arcularius HHB13444]|uniref:Uncharacterized protein n=1 Tax=Polyporus arcularius HHB13444 TaxID=1314778 RepID=A0A5C3NZN9_9APHY|nr:hypothetical protein K466DRAFT_648231 [Polyporus arcularius HHB13444]
MPWCHGCDKEVKTQLRQHEKKCSTLLQALQDAPSLKRKHEDEERERHVRQRRLEEERVARELAAQEEQARRQPTSLAGLPEHIRPQHPPTPAPAPPDPSPPIPEPGASRSGSPTCVDQAPLDTRPNRFGVFRRYFGALPSRDPEEGLTINAFTDSRNHLRPPLDDAEHDPLRPFGTDARRAADDKGSKSFAPFANISIWRCMRWLYNGSNQKTPGELNRLIREVFLAPEYCRDDLVGFDARRENKRLDEHAATSDAFGADDGWRKASVFIRLPKEGRAYASEHDAPLFEVKNVFVRSFREVIKVAYQDRSVKRFHWFPFQWFWQRKSSSPDIPAPVPERLISETYNSDAMLRLHEEIQHKARAAREPGDADDLEYVVAPVQIYSDSTHLANFGTASLWPIYLFFGSLTKYIRSRPNAFAAHHLAYIVSLPATVQQAYQEVYNEPASEAVLRFCKRELMNQIWHLLLDADFVQAYVHGILIECDMNARKNHIRVDNRLTHRKIEAARKQIFERGAPPEGTAVEGMLQTLVADMAQSAFSDKLSEFGHDVYQMLVPDIMHEFELGVWKGIFRHLVRVLIAAGGDGVQRLDARFSRIPTFGRDTVRRFGPNISAMKKLAARDFEDILQCAYFTFDGLLADTAHDKIVMKMIFVLATWHALAKLRLHSDSTLTYFEHMTQVLGTVVRAWVRHVCSAYVTKELPSETVTRQRRKAAKTKRADNTTPLPSTGTEIPSTEWDCPWTTSGRKSAKDQTLQSISMRAYTSPQGELEHRRVKKFYVRTNKNVQFAWQIARHQRRQQYLHTRGDDPSFPKRPTRKAKPRRARLVPVRTPMHLPFEASESLPSMSPKEHTQISEEQTHPINIVSHLADNKDDPSFKDFSSQLDSHVFQRLEALAGRPTSRDPTPEECINVRIDRGRLYIHKITRVNWTSYDMRREQDSINPRMHADIMMLAPPGSEHPYLYARVISVFHVNAYRLDPEDSASTPDPELLHILWVRWYDLDRTLPGGFRYFRPHCLKLAALDDEAFGFISPGQVLRGVHIAPAERFGRSDQLTLPYRMLMPESRPSRAFSAETVDDDGLTDRQPCKEDWNYYYIGMWSDRDLFMRFLGGGVGHADQAANFAGVRDDADLDDLALDLDLTCSSPHAEEESISDDEDPEHGYAPSGDEDEDQEEGETHADVPGGEGAGEWEDVHNGEDEEDGEGDNIVDEYELTNYAQY